MSLASNARVSSQLTAAAYRLVPAVRTELLDTGYYAVVGECGHRLDVVSRGHRLEAWQSRIEAGKRHRRRCESCVKDSEAHEAKLLLGW